MKELQYPFDARKILQNKRSLRREFLAQDKPWQEIKIALLSGSTIGDVKKILELFLLNHEIRPVFFEGNYNCWYEDVVFDNQKLAEFAPDMIYIHTTNKNIELMPDVDDSEKIVENKLSEQYQKFETAWKKIKTVYRCPIIQNNFDPVLYRVYGNSDVYHSTGETCFINKLNQRFYEYANNAENGLYINDINYLASWIGLEKWADNTYWYSYKYALNIEAIPTLCYSISNIIKSLLGKNKKSLVLDLDNTLWGGVIGDDGVENLRLGIETPQGMAFQDFQRYLKKLKKLGVMLNVNSKNDIELAMKGFDHPSSILKRDDFVEIMANWDDKYLNLQRIIKKLNIMPDSIVFVDDNPIERGAIRRFLPEVEVLELTCPEEYLGVLDKAAYFESTIMSEDDRNRVEMYKQNRARSESQFSFTDYDAYLKSLEMTSEMQPFGIRNIARVTQLINKTNQFNLTTKRFVQTEVEEMAHSDTYITFCGDLKDKFGDNGIVTAFIGKRDGKRIEILLWIMSCRVFKRSVEFAVFDTLVKKCKENGIKYIEGHYIPTKKNKLVSGFYEELGFTKIREIDAESSWTFKIPEKYESKNNVIEVKDYE